MDEVQFVQFLGSLERPDVDKIDGLSPVIAIEQKTTSKSPRSTVGTITEIYDFLRLLFARAADAYSFNTREMMVSYNDIQIKDLILESFNGKRISILSPIIRSRKGHFLINHQLIIESSYVFLQWIELGSPYLLLEGQILLIFTVLFTEFCFFN